MDGQNTKLVFCIKQVSRSIGVLSSHDLGMGFRTVAICGVFCVTSKVVIHCKSLGTLAVLVVISKTLNKERVISTSEIHTAIMLVLLNRIQMLLKCRRYSLE